MADITSEITRYIANKHTPADVEIILKSYQPLVDKYCALLRGRTQSPVTGRSFLADKAIRVFLWQFKGHGNLECTSRWLACQCQQLNARDLEHEVRCALLESIHECGTSLTFPKHLSRNLKGIIPEHESYDECMESAEYRDPEIQLEKGPTVVEELLDAYGVPLTIRERITLRMLRKYIDDDSAAYAHTAIALGIRPENVQRTVRKIRSKAKATRMTTTHESPQ